MHVRVDEPRQQGAASQVHDLSAPGRQAEADVRDLPVLNLHAGARWQEAVAIEDSTVAKQQLGRAA